MLQYKWEIGFIIKKTKVKDSSYFLTIFTKNKWKQSFFIRWSKKSSLDYLSIWFLINFNYKVTKWLQIIEDFTIISSINCISYEYLVILSFCFEIINTLTHDNDNTSPLIFKLINDIILLINDNIEKNLLNIFFEIRILHILWFIAPLNIYSDTNLLIDFDAINYFDELHWAITKSKTMIFLSSNDIKVLNVLQNWELENIKKINLATLNVSLFRKILLNHCPYKIRTESLL